MGCILKEVNIINFKSLKNVEVPLKRFNVLVGPNGSGKTNFIEFFKFLKRALTDIQSPYVPCLDWWDYRNIVWGRKEELPITARLSCILDGIDLEYKVTFSGIGGAFTILTEELSIGKVLILQREGAFLKIKHSSEFFAQEKKQIESEIANLSEVVSILAGETRKDPSIIKMIKNKLTPEHLSEQVTAVPKDMNNLLMLQAGEIPHLREYRKGKGRMIKSEIIGKFADLRTGDFCVVFVPQITKHYKDLNSILQGLFKAISGFTILKHPNMKEVKAASLPRRESYLAEDSSNLNNVLYKWFSEKGKLPERITTLLSELFPHIKIGFESTFDGRIYIKIYENDIELHPPSIPDGFYKVLSLLAAIELNPSLLAIDEVENSLHNEALEFVIDELKECDSTVIIATHSPLVVDMVRLEDLLVVEKTIEGTSLKRVTKPAELRKKLADLKITQSESWLYSELKQ